MTRPPPLPETAARAYPWFIAGTASWFGAFGMQQVILSWIVVGELGAPAETVGLVQTLNMLPALGLLLVGGAVADRRDPRGMLLAAHLLAPLPVLALAGVVAAGHARLSAVILCGVSFGVLTAFAVPARDALLSRVAGNDLMRAVTGLTASQFGAQAAGSLLAGLSRWLGSPTMLAVQAGVVAAGVLFMRRVPRAAPAARAASSRRHPLYELSEGLRITARVPELRGPVVLVFAVGVLFMGPYLVLFPLMVRDVYGGEADMLSVVLMLFPLGTILGSIVLRFRGIERKGLAMLVSLASGALTMAVIGCGVPFVVLVVLTFVWGLGGAVFMNCSRTLYQQAAPPEQRGRVLAVYQVGFNGGAPLGAMAAGLVSGAVGTGTTIVAFSAAMGLVLLGMTLFTRVGEMR